MPEAVASIVLDNEAVAALSDVRHPKHRVALSFLEGAQRRRGRGSFQVLVPVAVRIEAGWDRRSRESATINRVSGSRDHPLTGDGANTAHRLRRATGVSVVDATVAEAVGAAPKPVVILTSDSSDMTALAALVEGDVRVVRL